MSLPIFGTPERQNAEVLLALAIHEDLGAEGDLTARLKISEEAVGCKGGRSRPKPQ